MHPETRALLYDLTIDQARATLNLSARAVAALVEEGLLAATLPQFPHIGVGLSDARFRSDQVTALAESAPAELARVRAAYPPRTPDYDRAIALGALIHVLY